MACWKAQWNTGLEWGTIGFFSSKRAAQKAASDAMKARGYRRANVRVVPGTGTADAVACKMESRRRRQRKGR